MRRVSTFALFVLIFAAGAFGQATPKESLLVLATGYLTMPSVSQLGDGMAQVKPVPMLLSQ